jgi:hypothetical protein
VEYDGDSPSHPGVVYLITGGSAPSFCAGLVGQTANIIEDVSNPNTGMPGIAPPDYFWLCTEFALPGDQMETIVYTNLDNLPEAERHCGGDGVIWRKGFGPQAMAS